MERLYLAVVLLSVVLIHLTQCSQEESAAQKQSSEKDRENVADSTDQSSEHEQSSKKDREDVADLADESTKQDESSQNVWQEEDEDPEKVDNVFDGLYQLVNNPPKFEYNMLDGVYDLDDDDDEDDDEDDDDPDEDEDDFTENLPQCPNPDSAEAKELIANNFYKNSFTTNDFRVFVDEFNDRVDRRMKLVLKENPMEYEDVLQPTADALLWALCDTAIREDDQLVYILQLYGAYSRCGVKFCTDFMRVLQTNNLCPKDEAVASYEHVANHTYAYNTDGLHAIPRYTTCLKVNKERTDPNLPPEYVDVCHCAYCTSDKKHMVSYLVYEELFLRSFFNYLRLDENPFEMTDLVEPKVTMTLNAVVSNILKKQMTKNMAARHEDLGDDIESLYANDVKPDDLGPAENVTVQLSYRGLRDTAKFKRLFFMEGSRSTCRSGKVKAVDISGGYDTDSDSGEEDSDF